MRHNWLTPVERQYVQTLLDEAIEHVKLRDMKTCAAFVQHAIEARRMSKSMLRPNVIDIFAKPKGGFCLVQRMLNRHAREGTPPESRGTRFGRTNKDSTSRH